MRAELERIEQIESYLMDKLSQSDKANFERELGGDAVLQSQVEFQENLIEGLQRMGVMYDAKNAYKIYRKRLWYKYLGIGLGLIGISLLAIILWSYNSVNYCDCSDNRMEYTKGEAANENDGNCVDTCFQAPIENSNLSLAHYEHKKDNKPTFAPKNVDFEIDLPQILAQEIEITEVDNNSNTRQILRPSFEAVSSDQNKVESDEPVEVVNDLFDDHPFYYRLEKMNKGYPARKNKLFNYLFPISDLPREWRSSNPRKNLGTILSSNNNEAYFDAAKKKRKRLIAGDTPTEYVVNKELKMDSVTMEPYFVYDTIPVGMNIPSLRVKGKNKNWVTWEILAVEIDSTYIDIVFNISQRENSYIYSITEESEFNMPTQFLFRNVSGEYDLVGEVREFGMETFDKEENYDSEGPVCHSTGHDIQFRQRIEMKSNSASILINYAYMVCASGVSTQYPVEDSLMLFLGWDGDRGHGGKVYVPITDDLGDTTASDMLQRRGRESKTPVNPEAADVEPLFPGGETAMFKWLNDEMDLSQLEGDGTVSGTIIVNYTVSETGKVTDVVIHEGLTPELDQHVLNIFNRMPDWSPGIVDGEPVSVYFSLPVVINNF